LNAGPSKSALQSFFFPVRLQNHLMNEPNIIRLPLKLVLRGNLIRCGVCIYPVILWFQEIIRGNGPFWSRESYRSKEI
ncbi:hypothetical protein Tco_0358126, partial [Tanacetum coccineum]